MNRDEDLELGQLRSSAWAFAQGLQGPLKPAELTRLDYLEAKVKRETDAKVAAEKTAAEAALAGRRILPRAVNPVIHEADIKPPKRRVDGAAWLAAVNKVAAQRELGDVTGSTIVQIATKIAWAVAKGAGVGRIALRVLGKLAVAGKETARKVVGIWRTGACSRRPTSCTGADANSGAPSTRTSWRCRLRLAALPAIGLRCSSARSGGRQRSICTPEPLG